MVRWSDEIKQSLVIYREYVAYLCTFVTPTGILFDNFLIYNVINGHISSFFGQKYIFTQHCQMINPLTNVGAENTQYCTILGNGTFSYRLKTLNYSAEITLSLTLSIVAALKILKFLSWTVWMRAHEILVHQWAVRLFFWLFKMQLLRSIVLLYSENIKGWDLITQGKYKYGG